jgi:UDP-sugar pyrophosphorylase
MKAKTLQVPTGENLSYGDENFIKFEEAGVKETQNAAFVLVAGGLGERLGYNGIKVNNDTANIFTLC